MRETGSLTGPQRPFGVGTTSCERSWLVEDPVCCLAASSGLKRSKVVILASQISKVVYNPSGGEGWTGDAQADTGALAYEAVEGPGVAYGGYGGVQEGARAWTGTGASAERGAPAERGSGAARPAAQSEASSGARGSSKVRSCSKISPSWVICRSRLARGRICCR